MLQSYKQFWKSYTRFEERTNRMNFWTTMLVHFLCFVILEVIAKSFIWLGNPAIPNLWTAFSELTTTILIFYFVLSLPPFLAITVRRLRDSNFSIYLIFLNLIPIAGTVALFILSLFPTSKNNLKHEFKRSEEEQENLELRSEPEAQSVFAHYFKGYFTYFGKTSRKNFWMSQFFFLGGGLLLILTIFLSQMLDSLFFGQPFIGSLLLKIITLLYFLGLFFPQLMIHIRRLRDTGLSDTALYLLLGALGILTSFKIILQEIARISYGINDYALLNYLTFLLILIFLATLIIVEVMPHDALKTTQKRFWFRN